jgi:hypothetical protein
VAARQSKPGTRPPRQFSEVPPKRAPGFDRQNETADVSHKKREIRMRLFMTLLLSAMFSIASHADSKPDLTGTWKLNMEKSKLETGQRIPYYSEYIMEIDHREPKLRIVEKIKTKDGRADRMNTWELTTDGKPGHKEGSDGTMWATWEGTRLATKIEALGLTFHRTFTIASDGKSITAEWEIHRATGVEKATEVWEKQ